MKVHVGHDEPRGDLGRYAQTFSVVEVASDAGQLPRTARLYAWRDAVGPDFVFSVVLPHEIGELGSEALALPQLDKALEAAKILRAQWLVVPTARTLRPSERSARRVAEFVEGLPKGEYRVAWEPGSGLWQGEAARRVADQLGIWLVEDLLSAEARPSAEVVYTRLRMIGQASRFGEGAAQDLMARLLGSDEAFVLTGARQAKRVQQLLRREGEWLSEGDSELPEGDSELVFDSEEP